MRSLNFSNKSVQWVSLILLALTWGSSFILMKKGLVYFDPSEVAAFRITLAWLVLLPIALRNLKVIRGNFWPLLVTGLFGNAIPAFLFALAQTQIPSALSGILNSLTSLFTLLIGVILFRTKTTWMQVTGVLVALLGAAGLIGFDSISSFGAGSQYALLVVAATAMYGIAVNTIKAKLHELRPTHITSLAFLFTGPWCALYLFFGTDFIHDLSARPESWMGVFYLSILAVVGTAIAVIIFNKLIKETTAVFATTVTYLIPVVALGWGLIDGETIELVDVAFMCLILAGIFMINIKNSGVWVNRFFR
mgnify:CR=1 FL=1|jgi:drug/metabolite transporter (DMT)-like permease